MKKGPGVEPGPFAFPHAYTPRMSTPAWRAATDAAQRSGVSIVPLRELVDTARVGGVIERVWGSEQAIPREMLRALQHAGTVLVGAEAGGELVGFAFGFLGFAQGLHLHSHMLGVVPDWQSRGVGYALKLAQRATCLDHGIEEMRWTYDPLLLRNARFNLVKVGAEAFRFLPEFYGEMTDRLNRGDRSDRFEVRWRLSSDRVQRAVHEGRCLSAEARDEDRAWHLSLRAEGNEGHPVPREDLDASAGPVVVQIPRDYQRLRGEDRDLARRWREASGRAFEDCFRRGFVARRMTQGAGYVFEDPDAVA